MSTQALDQDFTPPRRPRVVPIAPPEKLSDADMRSNAFRVAQGIEDLQKERDANRTTISDLRALIEQHVVKESEQRSEIESLRVELNTEKAERIRLGSGLEHIIHVAHKLADQPEIDPA